jgi:hypothetical protein
MIIMDNNYSIWGSLCSFTSLSEILSVFSASNSDHNFEDIRKRRIAAEANFILSTQLNNHKHPAYGALNDVPAGFMQQWFWIVPRENALAMMGLLLAHELIGEESYKEAALRVASFLPKIQDPTDGSWFNQYYFLKPFDDVAKSPTQAAEVMMAYKKLRFKEELLNSMILGAEYLLSCMDVKNKAGIDDGLICGGKSINGEFNSDRWTQDNAFGFIALSAASEWCDIAGKKNLSDKFSEAADRVLEGINKYLFDQSIGVWHKSINKYNAPTDSIKEWGNYSPVMLGLPVKYDAEHVGEWVHQTFQLESGAVRQNTGEGFDKLSPGFSFQAAIAWFNTGHLEYISQALNWAKESGLWHRKGGWIDWQTTNGKRAPSWQRFIDTSFYSLATLNEGYKFFDR